MGNKVVSLARIALGLGCTRVKQKSGDVKGNFRERSTCNLAELGVRIGSF